MVVGTYTDAGRSRGIYSYRFDQDRGYVVNDDKSQFPEAPDARDCMEIENPSYLTIAPDAETVLYAVSELPATHASAYAIRLYRDSATMQMLGGMPIGGGDPCYIATNGTSVMTANYSTGDVTEFPIASNGNLLPYCRQLMTPSGGPDHPKQDTPRAHCAVFAAQGKVLLVSAFSADAVICYDLSAARESQIRLHPGFGPRHIVMNNDESRVYVIGELSGDISVIDMTTHHVIQTVCADNGHARGSADLRLSPDGLYLYASIRLRNDGIAVFKVNPADGTISPAGYQRTGLHPRNFRLTPNGKFVLVACRDSGYIQIFERDAQSGLLSDTGRTIILDRPVCIDFA